MTYESPYGKLAGLRERIDDWMEKFAQDKSYPWVGTGLIDDLEAVARYMDGYTSDSAQEIADFVDAVILKSVVEQEGWDL